MPLVKFFVPNKRVHEVSSRVINLILIEIWIEENGENSHYLVKQRVMNY